MWINIEVVPRQQEIIYLPQSIAERLNDNVYVEFGSKKTSSRVIRINKPRLTAGDSYDNPLKIWISDKLALKLMIPDSLIYQMKFERNRITIGPVIGLLLGNHNYMYNPQHMEKYSDRCRVLNKTGGLIYAFSPGSVDWENSFVYGLYYNISEDRWKYGTFPLPSVIYRRDFHTNPDIIKKLKEITGGRLFNSWRFTKYSLYQYINKDRELRRYLPATELSENYEQAKRMIDEYEGIILKPTNLSRGRGICIIRKEGSSYILNDYRWGKEDNKTLNGDEELEEFFKENNTLFNRYIIQEHLSLAKVDNSPFDVRVVMQKDESLKWKCSGIECRVAGNSILLTNISRGGYALTIEETLKKAFPDDADTDELRQQLDEICLKICNCLDQMGHHFAEFGMDIAIDEDRHFWLIEVNVFPSFKGFKKMDYNTYLAIRYTPIHYAAHLAGF